MSLSLLTNNIKASRITSAEAILFNRVVSLLKENLCNSLCVTEIVKASNASESTLKRIFNKYAGLSIHKYYLLLKLNYATELLKRGDSVSNVASELGFCSQAYFSKTYKREFGVSPSAVKETGLLLE